MDSDDWFTLAELTERLGALAWVEEQLAEVLQAWSGCEAEPSVAVHFATVSGHHRWHGEVVRGCLPTSPQLEAESAVKAPTEGWEATIAALTTLVDPSATVARLKALAKVANPWLDREVGALLELSRPVSDAAMMRWLRFVTLDHESDHDATEVLLSTQSSTTARLDDHLLISTLDLT